MKGVNFVTNYDGKKIAAQVDLKLLKKNRQVLDDLFDVIIAESRKDDEVVPWEQARKELKKARKI